MYNPSSTLNRPFGHNLICVWVFSRELYFHSFSHNSITFISLFSPSFSVTSPASYLYCHCVCTVQCVWDAEKTRTPSGNFDERVAKWSYAVNYSYKKCSLELVSIIWWSSHHNNINVGVSFWWLKLFFFPIDDHILPISINSSGTLDIPGRQSLRICLELILFLFYFLACWWFWF